MKELLEKLAKEIKDESIAISFYNGKFEILRYGYIEDSCVVTSADTLEDVLKQLVSD